MTSNPINALMYFMWHSLKPHTCHQNAYNIINRANIDLRPMIHSFSSEAGSHVNKADFNLI
jgi:hypothetical protein